MIKYTRSEIEDIINELIESHSEKVCREIDACACRTSYDYQLADEARDLFWNTKERVINELVNRIYRKGN